MQMRNPKDLLDLGSDCDILCLFCVRLVGDALGQSPNLNRLLFGSTCDHFPAAGWIGRRRVWWIFFDEYLLDGMHVFFLQWEPFDEFPKLWSDRFLRLLLARLLIARLLDF